MVENGETCTSSLQLLPTFHLLSLSLSHFFPFSVFGTINTMAVGPHISYMLNLQTPRIVSLLSESYNPHVRYGAALAVGISCAGSGLREAISLLEPLTSDVVDFVRQGALIAMAMVMIQTNESCDSRVGAFRYHFYYTSIFLGKASQFLLGNFRFVLFPCTAGVSWRKLFLTSTKIQ